MQRACQFFARSAKQAAWMTGTTMGTYIIGTKTYQAGRAGSEKIKDVYANCHNPEMKTSQRHSNSEIISPGFNP